jgi:hypothetical protein
MTQSHHLALPKPAGSVAGDWQLFNFPEDTHRVLTWSRHDAAGVVVAVEGTQYADGRIDRAVVVRPESADVELTAANARRLAAALLDAADAMDLV